MVGEIGSLRRVVVGNNAEGKSHVVFDSAAENLKHNTARPGAGMTELWCYRSMPIDLSDERDYGLPPFNEHPPQLGGFFRLVHSLAAPPNYNPSADPNAVPASQTHEDKETGRGSRGGRQAGRSPTHRTRSVDYGFVASGQRRLILDDEELLLFKNDFVIQLGNYHAWFNPAGASVSGFVMIGADYDK